MNTVDFGNATTTGLNVYSCQLICPRCHAIYDGFVSVAELQAMMNFVARYGTAYCRVTPHRECWQCSSRFSK